MHNLHVIFLHYLCREAENCVLMFFCLKKKYYLCTKI